MKSFEFKNVLLIKPYVFALLGFFLIGPIVVTVAFFLKGSLPALISGAAVGLTVMFFLFSRLSKNVTISFDTDHIIFNYDNRTISYLKTQLKGFYSFNHFRDGVSTVSMCFEFTDGKNIDLSDYLATGRLIPEKLEMLQQFLTTAEKELDFAPLYVDKKRKLGKIGSTWFAKAA